MSAGFVATPPPDAARQWRAEIAVPLAAVALAAQGQAGVGVPVRPESAEFGPGCRRTAGKEIARF